MSSIKRISTEQLRVGMYIAELSNSWIPDNNLRRHGIIKRDSAIEQIRRLGVADVYIDVSKGADCAEGVALESVRETVNEELSNIQRQSYSNEPVVAFDEERDIAEQLHHDALHLVGQVMEDVKMGNAVKVQPVEDMADSIAESIRRNQNALSCVSRMRDKDSYLMEHSFSVAVLMGILARTLGFNNDDLHEIVTGALLHDIGKIRIPNEILHKPDSLTPVEWEEMKRHVQYGEEALAQVEGVPKIIEEICSQHHERLDGTGYPRGLTKGAISIHGRMGAVVDVYDAITADRCYHQGMAPTTAMKKLLEWSGNHLDKEIVYPFIACMSIYPAGSLVLLDNQKLAVVTEVNLRQQNQPVVRTVWDLVTKSKVTPVQYNLAHSDCQRSIVKAIDPIDYQLTNADLLTGI